MSTTLSIKTTDDARAYVAAWMQSNFPTDRTFHRYIEERLAGDFAFQLANALALQPAAIKPIRTLDDHAVALAEAQSIAAAQPAAGTPDGDRLEVLSVLIEAFEVKNFPTPSAASAPATPPDCDPAIHQDGAVVAVLDCGMLAMEGLVKEANRIEPGMDWHYFGGRAMVKTLGDVAKARAALVRAMPRFIDGGAQ